MSVKQGVGIHYGLFWWSRQTIQSCPAVACLDEAVLMSPGITGVIGQFSFVTSERGRNLLLYMGCKFCYHRTLSGGDQRWKCTTKHCNAYLKYNSDSNTLTDVQAKHCHPPPEPTRLGRQLLSNEAKRQAIGTSLGAKEIIQDVMAEEGITMSSDDVKRIKANINRAKNLNKLKHYNLPVVVEGATQEDDSSQDGASNEPYFS